MTDTEHARSEDGLGDVAWPKPAPERHPSVDLRTDVAHSARMYDYYLGGKDISRPTGPPPSRR